MASVASPYGLLPVGTAGSNPFTGGSVRQFRLTADNTVAMYKGGPVTLIAGAPNGIGANGTAGTPSANLAVGVFAGVQYTDPTLKYTLHGQYVPVSCITAGWTNVLISVWDDPNMLFMIQSDAAVNQAHIGWNANMNFASSTIPGSATTGVSSVSLDTPVNTDNYMLRVVDIVNQNSIFGGGLSAPSDSYTDCIVRWNFGAHIYHNHAVNA